VDGMANVICTNEEIAFMRSKCYFLPSWFFDFLRGYRYNPTEVHISQDSEGHLKIEIEGKWYSAIKWEMMLLSTISEVCHILRGEKVDLVTEYQRSIDKAKAFLSNGLLVSDMGTRRRFSFEVQNQAIKAFKFVNETMGYDGKFVGTSNVWFAMQYGLTPIGTMSHQIIEAEEVMSGVMEANYQVQKKWTNTYKGYLGLFLCDCFGEKAYFNNANRESLMLFDGIRIDSGDEFDQLEKHMALYKKFAIDPATKSIIFSNALDASKAIEIHKFVNGRMKDSYGVGTYICCNFDATECCKALPIKHKNIVIKLTGFRVDNSRPWSDTVKLSCDKGKTLGNPDKCAYLLKVLDEN
jgi:nicotinate phosphoribosyltransferase